MCPAHNGSRKSWESEPNDTGRRRAYLAFRAPGATQATPKRRRTMQKTKRGMNGQERLSFGSLMLTIVIANVLVLA